MTRKYYYNDLLTFSDSLKNGPMIYAIGYIFGGHTDFVDSSKMAVREKKGETRNSMIYFSSDEHMFEQTIKIEFCTRLDLIRPHIYSTSL